MEMQVHAKEAVDSLQLSVAGLFQPLSGLFQPGKHCNIRHSWWIHADMCHRHDIQSHLEFHWNSIGIPMKFQLKFIILAVSIHCCSAAFLRTFDSFTLMFESCSYFLVLGKFQPPKA